MAHAAQPHKRSTKTYSLEYQDNLGLIHLQAKFGHRWATRNGCVLDYDDMVQEASIAFLDAVRGFDPSKGITFSAYYTKAAFSQFRKTIGIMSGVKNLNPAQRAEIKARKDENEQRKAAGMELLPEVTYGLRPILFSEITTADMDETFNFVDTLASDDLTPEQQLAFKTEFAAATAALSPMAQLVLSWLREPPEEMLEELRALEALADEAKAGGRNAPRIGARDGVTLANIGRFLHLVGGDKVKGEFAAVERELLDVVKRLEAA